MSMKIKNLINGEWKHASSGETFESINPATRETVGIVPKSGKTDVDKAVGAARTAFSSWRQVPAPKRGEILFRAAELLVRRKAELAKIMTQEMGKIYMEALGDVQEAIDITYYMAGEGRRLSGETVPSETPNKDAKSVRVPVGVFALITPWNFPIAIPAWKICPALICGNTVVFKPSPDTPVCATRFVEILLEAGLPKGVVNLIHGMGPEAGEPLVKHPKVDAVSFTGSSFTGEHLETICAKQHKPISTETGGKNVIIVMEDADLELAVDGAIWGGFGTTGQRCTASSRLVVHAPIYSKFLKKFKEAAQKLRIGDGLQKTTQMGPVINEPQYKKVLNYIKICQKERSQLVLVRNPYKAKGPLARGFFIEPTIFADVKPRMRIAQEEIFGPVVSVLKAKDLKDAIRIANEVPFGLSSAIFSQDVNVTAMAERELDTGLVYINASTIGAEVQLPFGGTKRTGIGPREAGGRGGALDHFSKWKVIYRDYSGKLQRAQID